MNDSVVCSSSRIRRRVSLVKPVGPGAAPLRARRQIREQECGLEVWGLECLAMRGLVPGRVIRGWFGSRSSFRVFSFPGANAVAVRACRAADSSHWWMSWHALLA